MKIALITGGESAERNISIKSASNIKEAIDFAETTTYILPEDTKSLIAELRSFDLVIPVIHGVGGEDGRIQGLLETLKVPYIFSGITAHSIGIDKILSKELAKSAGLCVAKNISKNNPEFPLFAKPRYGGSSVHSLFCKSAEDLRVLTEQASEEIMMEEIISGKEFTVGIVEHAGKIIALPVVEIIPQTAFFDFKSKYDQDSLAKEVCPAVISDTLAVQLQEAATKIHTSIGARHISRSDFIVTDENKIYFLEINTIPGMTDMSLIPKMLSHAGLSLSELLKEWCTG